MLKKCLGNVAFILPTESIRVEDSISYEEIPVQILDHQVHKLRTKKVAFVKVLWRNQFVISYLGSRYEEEIPSSLFLRLNSIPRY
ncbi:hypothetical protein MTR67_047709 [Solanum verrucosum]|uniref:Uncharacterized protein n=1 Tax=Solanum verrucosum TaxID=315347 RepID=A0AAF0UYZ7_SOLVR|nr:hypothetical protein MTR67_047709 [Solanum verrucosum]